MRASGLAHLVFLASLLPVGAVEINTVKATSRGTAANAARLKELASHKQQAATSHGASTSVGWSGSDPFTEAMLKDLGFPANYNRMCRCQSCSNCPTVHVNVTVQMQHIYEILDVERFAKLDIIIRSTWVDDRVKNLGYSGRVDEHPEGGLALWHPDLEIRNQKDPAQTTSVSMKLNQGGTDGEVTVTRRVLVNVVSGFDCWRFPFDSHHLQVEVASFSYGADQVLLHAVKPSESQEEEELPENGDWTSTKYEVTDAVAKSLFSGKDSYVTASLSISRISGMVILEIIFPLAIIVMFTFTALLIGRDDGLGERVNIAAIGFLTVMAYQYVVTEALPKVSSLLWIHYYLIVCFVFNFLVAWAVVFLHYYEAQKKRLGENPDEKTEKIEMCLIKVLPVGFVIT